MGSVLGFVGLGNMGLPMTVRLVEAGHEVIAFDVDPGARARAESAGAAIAGAAVDVADRAETVLTSLPNPAVVRDVTVGSRGLADGEKITTWVDLSTTGAETIRAVSETLSTRRITTVDAPVSGGVRGAWGGTLAVMAAAPATVFDAVRPILDTFGTVFHVGAEPGLGQAMKLANNYLSATAMAATSEAVVFGLKAGLDASVMIDVFNSGTGRNSATADKFPRSILPRTFDHGFTTGLMYKDLQLLSEQAGRLGVPMWIAESVRQLWLYALAQDGADADFTTMYKHLEQWVGVEANPDQGTASGSP